MSWHRGQSYSQDLRDRVMAAVDGGMGVYDAAPPFSRRRGGATARDFRERCPPWPPCHRGKLPYQMPMTVIMIAYACYDRGMTKGEDK